MECPYCGKDSRVLDSRGSAESVRRRRECMTCGRRFTTYERLAPPEIRVVKRDGSSEPFDRAKLLRAAERVCRDRPVGQAALEAAVRGLEASLVDSGVQWVTSGQLAEKLLVRLEELDRLAARRFASNYQHEDGAIRLHGDEAAQQLALPIAPPVEPAAPPPEPARTPSPGRKPRAAKKSA